MLDKGAVGHDLAPEAGVWHTGPSKECLDRVQQLFVRHDVHEGNEYHKFPTHQALMLGIYEIAVGTVPWDIRGMAVTSDKKESAQQSALTIAERLAQNPHPISERQWTKEAEVSPSFFSNLRGTPTKPPSDPSIDQLRKILRVRGISLSEFFLPEAHGALAKAPTKQALEQALADVWEGLPKGKSRQITFVAESVLRALGLPENAAATQGEDLTDEPAARAE